MTQTGYYEYRPTVGLSRPVAFSGHPGSAAREIVYDLAAVTGLPLHDVDRLVEHASGQTLWSAARQHGTAAVQAKETDQLTRVLGSRPPGLVLIGEGGWSVVGRLARVRERASLVFFRLPPAACYWALRRQAEARDGFLGNAWLPDRLAHPGDLQPLLRSLGPVAAAADRIVDLEHRGVHETVLDLQQALPALGGA